MNVVLTNNCNVVLR